MDYEKEVEDEVTYSDDEEENIDEDSLSAEEEAFIKGYNEAVEDEDDY